MTDIEAINNELHSQLKDFNYCKISYRVYPSEALRGYKHSQSKAYHQLEKYPLFSMTPAHSRFMEKYIKLQQKKDIKIEPFMFTGEWPDGFVPPTAVENDSYGLAKNALFSEYEINSEYSLYVQLPGDKFVGHFIFHSKLNNIDLNTLLSQKFVKKNLELTHFYLSRTYPSIINPYVNDGKIKKRTLSVLEQVARGANRHETANTLFMSSRGVDYHLEKIRENFKAKNNSDLIRLVKEGCII
ncbi:helix-turn-helix transcriptional regulator [Shewanella sp. TC10]|uniref:helix-turn-helix transcriptional regulator n=1 Tax=Shewanella sp. TC10 TaxID=1419739 RepID=UPI001892C820|nr:LuxR C-terminal-related transcriptional regulator [Shewanella sp. TC10]